MMPSDQKAVRLCEAARFRHCSSGSLTSRSTSCDSCCHLRMLWFLASFAMQSPFSFLHCGLKCFMVSFFSTYCFFIICNSRLWFQDVYVATILCSRLTIPLLTKCSPIDATMHQVQSPFCTCKPVSLYIHSHLTFTRCLPLRCNWLHCSILYSSTISAVFVGVTASHVLLPLSTVSWLFESIDGQGGWPRLVNTCWEQLVMSWKRPWLNLLLPMACPTGLAMFLGGTGPTHSTKLANAMSFKKLNSLSYIPTGGILK
jgi:hypothetical protein